MFYQAYELAHAFATPYRMAANLGQQLFRSPLNPLSHTTAGRAIAAACDVFESTTRRYGKPEWGFDSFTLPSGEEASVHPKIVKSKTFCNLIHFERSKTSSENDPKVLIVAPMSGHHATLLRGTVTAMLPEHDVYITDWVDAALVPASEGKFDFHSYVDYVIEFFQFLGENVHVIAVCQPGPPVLAAISLMSADKDPCVPATMTFMGSPIDPRESPTLPNKLANERPLEWFEQNVTDVVPFPHSGVGRKVYPGFMQLTGFMSMNLERHYGAHMKLFENLVKEDGESVDKHRAFYDEYLSVMDLTSEFYLSTISIVFQECLLPQGKLKHHGKKVDPSAINRTALLAIEGERDDISGLGQTRASLTICTGIPDQHKFVYIQPSVGHYGVFNGKRWEKEIQPRIRNFIRSHLKTLPVTSGTVSPLPSSPKRKQG